VAEIHEDPAIGYGIHEEFLIFSDTSGYPYLIDESDDKAAVAPIAQAGSGMSITITGDDNEEGWFKAGNNVIHPFIISDTAGADCKLWFECRWKPLVVTDDTSIVVGLVDANLAAGDNTLQDADTGAVADLGFIGFQTLCADGDALNVSYRKNGGALTVPIAAFDVPAANTWIKSGFRYDPEAPASKRITFYADGAEFTSTYITATNIAAATFPDGVALNFVAGAKVGDDLAQTLSVDWWRCYQLRA
jgi:hypothetical protein